MGEQIKDTTEGDTDNTDKPAEKSLADTLYPDPDKKVEDDEKVDEVVEDDKKDDEVVDDEKKDESEDKGDEDKATYEDFTLPEGIEEVSPEAIELFKGLDLSQEDAQKLVDHGTKIQLDTIDLINDAKEAQKKEWTDIIDKDLKVELPKGQDLARKILSEEDFNSLNESGLGDHPGMVRVLAKLADFAGEDFMSKETPSVEVKKELTLAETMYPGQK